MVAGGQLLKSSIRDAASVAPDSAAFRREVLDAVRVHVPFDAGCLAGTDPAAALVPTSLTTVGYDDPRMYAAVVDIEYGAGNEPGQFQSMMRRDVPIRTLREATGGAVRRSRQYAELLAPYGLHDEVRMIFRGSDGACWGMFTMSRASGREFTNDEIAVLGTVLTDVGDGLRAMLFRDSTRELATSSEGPAIAVLTADNDFEMTTTAAQEYFDRLGWGPPGRPVRIAPAAIVAARLRHSERDSLVLRARTADGEWVVIRAGRLDSEHPPRRIVLTIERARPPEIASLMASAYGLTRRESEVFAHVLAGESRDEMARALFISPYTVQDHLKSIFAKTGVSSRRSLVAKLVHTEYLPRLGTPVGPDGWFVRASERRMGTTPSANSTP